jgi:FkbM family methyltransferase
MKTGFRLWVWQKFGLACWRSTLPYGAHVYFDLCRLGFRPKVIFDVGANVGQTSTLLTKLWPDSQVWAFEPVPRTYAALVRNTSAWPHVKANNLALSNYIGKLNIFLDNQYSELSSLENAGLQGGKTEIEATTMDAFRQQSGCLRADLIKIDTEGHELSVLAGSEKTFRDCPPQFCVIEGGFNGATPFVDSDVLKDWFQKRDYRLAGIYDHGLHPVTSYLERADLLFVHRSWKRHS